VKTSRVLHVAWQGLGANKLRTFLMMLGIVVGIAAFTVIMAVGEGAKAELARRANQMFAQAPITVLAKQPGSGFVRGTATSVDAIPPTLTAEDAQAILDQVPQVAMIGPTQRQANVALKYKERSAEPMLFGVVPEWHVLRNYKITEGEFITEDDLASAARVCVIGQTVLRELFGLDGALDESIRIQNTPFRVKGILGAKGVSPGGGDFDNRVVIPLSTFSRRLYNVTHLSQIVIGLKDPRDMKQAAAEIEGLLRDRHSIARPEDDDFTVRVAESVVRVAGKTSHTLTIFLGVVAAISLLVGGIVVMNIMLISVSERTREIGTRRAVGATRRDIVAQFLVEALLVTTVAGACGVALGTAVSLALPRVGEIHTAISWQAIALSALFSIGVGLAFGIQPARRAASLDPVEALRAD